MNKWDAGSAPPLQGNEADVNPDDDLSWLNEKSRDELTDLLVKADTLIKERENGALYRRFLRFLLLYWLVWCGSLDFLFPPSSA